MTLQKALSLARLLRDGPLYSDSTPITVPDALKEVREARGRMNFNWITGAEAEQTLLQELVES